MALGAVGGGGKVVTTGAEPRHGAATGFWPRRRRALGVAMLIAALLPALAYPLGSRLADGTHLVILLRAFDGPVPYVAVAAVLLIAGAGVRPLPVVPLVLAVILGVIVLAGCLAFSAFLRGWEQGRTVRAPDGADRRAVIWHGSAAIDPLYRVTVIQGTGLGAREWEAACLDADDPHRELKAITWATPARLHLTDAAGREYTVNLDPNTGHPQNTPIMDC